jgi:cytochrome c biogenesis protein CcdA
VDLSLTAVTALWLGILCAISPCPLATNVAAISFVSYHVTDRKRVLLSGILYTLGRSAVYVAISLLVVQAMVNTPWLSNFLQNDFNKIMGILLILVGLILLDLWKINLPGFSPSQRLQERLDNAGVIGSFLLGGLFALAFCPVSAALFFGSLIPLAIQARSGIGYPLVFGIGTALPVMAFAVLIALGSRYVQKIYHGITRIEVFAKRVTGVIFIVIGLYYVLTYIFEIPIEIL